MNIIPKLEARGGGKYVSGGDMELRAAAMAAIKSVREDQARLRVGSPVA